MSTLSDNKEIQCQHFLAYRKFVQSPVGPLGYIAHTNNTKGKKIRKYPQKICHSITTAMTMTATNQTTTTTTTYSLYELLNDGGGNGRGQRVQFSS